MLTFKVTHKYCKAVKEISGIDIYDALNNANLSANIWIEERN